MPTINKLLIVAIVAVAVVVVGNYTGGYLWWLLIGSCILAVIAKEDMRRNH
jgi:hypothetical protein